MTAKVHPLTPRLRDVMTRINEGNNRQIYRAMLKRILKDQGDDILKDFDSLKAASGEVTLLDIGKICVTYDLHFKTVMDFLSNNRRVRSWAYEEIIAGKFNGKKFKVADLLDQALEELRKED